MRLTLTVVCFSALQRAENSSNRTSILTLLKTTSFSALQRAENSSNTRAPSPQSPTRSGFSALQRAENSSKPQRLDQTPRFRLFQCSSASRKFLKSTATSSARSSSYAFQCSSASRKFLKSRASYASKSSSAVSVLFSEPKIPQKDNPASARVAAAVSVLFSEPKIPQRWAHLVENPKLKSFSALQRAENSSNARTEPSTFRRSRFQCSSASRKFLKFVSLTNTCNDAERFSALQRAENSSKKNTSRWLKTTASFSALQRAENSSNGWDQRGIALDSEFQCSSASRKFLKLYAVDPQAQRRRVSVLFSEPKIPQIAVVAVR